MDYTEVEQAPDGTVCTVTVRPARALAADEDARLRHAVELGCRGLLRRYIIHVAQWGAMKTALAKLTEDEARVLGIHRHWADAQRTFGRRMTPADYAKRRDTTTMAP